MSANIVRDDLDCSVGQFRHINEMPKLSTHNGWAADDTMQHRLIHYY